MYAVYMDGWVTVSRGPIWQVQLEAGRLAEEGIEAYLPDETIKVMDPFATGGLPLHTDLKVSAEDAARARELLDQQAATVAADAAPDADGKPGDDQDREAIEALARRTRWAALALITLPFAFVGSTAWNLSWLVAPIVVLLVVRRRKKRALQ